ncbi:thioredoxin-disulfide reductase [bacterium]|nr:thioredoxin-disulfide reductase [bacterium]
MDRYDVVIVGAGTAGLTAAIYVQRANRSALVLEAKSYGGQIINTPDIENYPGIKHVSGFDFSTTLYEQATELGAKVTYAEVTGVDDEGSRKVVHTADGTAYEAGAVIIATGARNRPLGIAREQELIGRGVSYCATCDGMFFRGKDVAVNGGGNTAVEDAAYLAGVCNKVYLIHRRDQFRADAADVERLRGMANVEFVLNATVTAIEGDEFVTGVQVTDKTDGSTRTLPVSALFVAIGQVPDNVAFRGVVDLDEKGYVVAGEDCLTRTPGVFAAGDCRTKGVRQLATAAGDGAVAASAAVAYLR